MNKEQRAALRKLAEGATPGPWWVNGKQSVRSKNMHYIAKANWSNGSQNAAHIAAANPSAILQLLDYIETLEKDAANKQARIDALTLEFCPEEMTKEQMVEWAKHQAPAQHRLICKRCGVDRFVSPCPENSILCPVIGDAALQGETE